MNSKQRTGRITASVRWLFLITLSLTGWGLLLASAFGGKVIADNTPNYVSTAKILGAADPSTTIEVSVWLNPHNRAGLDSLTQSLYDPASPNYRHWLKPKDIAARFAPTVAEAKTVQRFLKSHNLKIVKIGSNNFYVRASGTIGDIEKAFHVQLNNYEVLGRTIRANDRDPYVDGAARALVANIIGLDSGEYEHPKMARGVAQGKLGSVRSAVTQPLDIFSPTCFDGVETESFSTNSNGTLPIGTYSGNHLNLFTGTSNGCGYTPPMIQAAYNLNGLYTKGYTGAGQTIGIIDWCGSFSIQSDANAFSAQYGLPPLTLSNFRITNTGQSYCEAYDQVEINLDVEWAHAIAPGANINLIVPPSGSFADVDEAEFEAVNSGLATVLSCSYGSPESLTPASILANENLINELAAASGISANFSTGDDGDFTIDGTRATVSAPADSPWATAVGGVASALNPDYSIAWQAGWGNNLTLLAEDGYVPVPPETDAFIGGGGGGPSKCANQTGGRCLSGFPKPFYQKKLPGKYRQLPDVSWLADPYTGAAILISIPGNYPIQVWQTTGGTSLATPMFSGLWAIANQEAQAGGAPPLGLAAPYLYSMPSGTIFDIVPVSSKTNVKASFRETTGTYNYNAAAVLGGTAPKQFFSAIWDYPFEQDTAAVISFGTDCDASGLYVATPCSASSALHTKKGWDNVTGVGTPNGQAFADFFYGK